MKKEVLTLERCREELLWAYRTPLGLWIFLVMLSLAATAFWGWLIAWIVSGADAFVFVHGVAIAICCIGYLPIPLMWIRFIIGLGTSGRIRQTIRDGELEIVEDTLKRAYEDHDVKGYGKYRRVDRFRVLVFEGYGAYKLPGRRHYAWSSRYAMYDTDIFESSREGDIFYIVRLKDDLPREPLQVYNTKFFWYSADGSTEPPRGSWRDSVSLE